MGLSKLVGMLRTLMFSAQIWWAIGTSDLRCASHLALVPPTGGGGKVTQVKNHWRRSSGTVSQAERLQRRCCFRRLGKRTCVHIRVYAARDLRAVCKDGRPRQGTFSEAKHIISKAKHVILELPGASRITLGFSFPPNASFQHPSFGHPA